MLKSFWQRIPDGPEDCDVCLALLYLIAKSWKNIENLRKKAMKSYEKLARKSWFGPGGPPGALQAVRAAGASIAVAHSAKRKLWLAGKGARVGKMAWQEGLIILYHIILYNMY